MSGLEHFEYIRQIGKGSYGEVTLQRHKRDRKQYVLKRINLKKASKREQHSAEQEAKLLSKLKHPNIVTYKDSFQKDGYLHIAMQFCEGGDLYSKLKEQKGTSLDERQVVEWFVQIAMALQYMHERNILHRDLKTQNIFLTKSKIIKVGDLGIARVLESSSDMATTLIGTPYYMSPELFSNKPYNHKSDVWALGCCVYEMATLKHAFNAKDMNSLVYKILRGRMPPMPKQYSQELLNLIKNMLHQEPDKRPSVNRILRDQYIKKNISIFLEETKKSRPSSGSRPSSASRQRPSTAPSRKPVASSNSSSNGPSSVRDSAVAKPPRIHLPGQDQVETERENVSIDNIDGASAQVPAPAIIRKPAHARKPSDGVKPDLAPIAEDKPVDNAKNLGSSSSSDSQDTVKSKAAQEQKSGSPPRKNCLSPKKKKNVLKKYSKDGDTDSIASVDSVSSVSSSASARSKKESIFKNIYTPRSSQFSPRVNQDFLSSANISETDTYGSEQPKPVDNPRPLPPPPRANESEGLPDRRRVVEEKGGENSKSSSTSSSKEENASWDVETPREPNLSARQRRREKNPAASSYERPNSARIHLKPSRRHESQKITKAEKSQMLSTPRSARTPRSSRTDLDLISPRSEYISSRYEYEPPIQNSFDPWDPYGPVKSRSNPKKVRQPSLAVSSSSEEETLKENEDFKVEKEKIRENKEMNNFISLLDTTLKMNKDDDKSDEEIIQESTPSHPGNGGDYNPTEMEIHRSASLPSVETLCNADRLTSRIQILHVDCVRGVGYEILHKAFEILSNIEDDELEPQLIDLMGKEKFDQYAGKIWQLKFCNECFEQLPHLRS